MDNFNRFFYGEAGKGSYGLSFGPVTHACIDYMKDSILKALDSIPVNPKEDGLFTVADYGTADGYATMPLMKQLIASVRQKHGDIAIQIVYEDQASSDFNSLFRRLHGLIPVPSAYLQDARQVYVTASGTSFFQQVLPDNSAHLIMSFHASHYLSKPAVKFQNSLERFPDATEEERQLVVAQAAQDWETFLLHRAAELKTGGMLIVCTPAEDPEKRLKGVQHFCQIFMEALLKVWRQMRDDGKITEEEFVDTNFHRCMHYLPELTLPLDDPDSRVSRAGLRLVQAETALVPCIVYRAWRHTLLQEGVDDRVNWAKGVINLHKIWAVHAFIRGLSNTRSQIEIEARVDELYKRVEKEVLAHGPTDTSNSYLCNYVFIRKI